MRLVDMLGVIRRKTDKPLFSTVQPRDTNKIGLYGVKSRLKMTILGVAR